jgi:hypothetical protein
MSNSGLPYSILPNNTKSLGTSLGNINNQYINRLKINANQNILNLDKKLENISKKNKNFLSRISNTLKSGSKSERFLNDINVIIIKTITIPSVEKIKKLNKIKILLDKFILKKEGFTDLIRQANYLTQRIDYYIKILGLGLNNNIEKKILFIQDFDGNNANIKIQQKSFYLKFLDNVIKIYNSAIKESNKKIYLEKLKIIDEIVHPLIRKTYVSDLNSTNTDIIERFKEIKKLEAELKKGLSSPNLHNA